MEGLSEIELIGKMDGDCVAISDDIGVEIVGQLTGDKDTGGLSIGVTPANDGTLVDNGN